MKLKHVLLTFTLFAACYSPQLGNPGFYCHPNDNPACPDGQKCVGNRCVSSANFDGGTGGDLAQRDGSSTNHDMASTNHDMASSQPDFSGPADFSMGGMPPCMCTQTCLFGCVGMNCCLEDTIAGTCNPDPTCTPS